MGRVCSSSIYRTVQSGTFIVLFSLTFYGGSIPQQQAPKKADDRINGKIQKVDTEGHVITLQLRSNLLRTIVYTGNTTFTYGKKTPAVDEVKKGRNMTCVGVFNEKQEFAARSCTIQ